MRKEFEFKEIADAMAKTYRAKNKDYGDSFGRSVQRHGLISALTRISDKYNRLEQLVMSGEARVKDETMEDTLLDMASYCIMTVMEIRRMNMEVVGKRVEEKNHFCPTCRHNAEDGCLAKKSGVPCVWELDKNKLKPIKKH